MSLIESALAKLRRGTESPPARPLSAPRPSIVVAAAAKVASALPEPVAELPEPATRIPIDMRALREGGYLPQAGLERRFADQYRHIKRPLIEKALAGGPDMRLIMVSSALPGDGKTFTSINLALSMARERDASVLLVDADSARARISEILGVRGMPGLLDALADPSVDIESLVVGTDVRGLQILPSGKFVEGATELLASARMGQTVARLGTRNPRRLILFDSAPLLASSEARVLMRISGQLVLVARVGVTPHRALADALAKVDRAKLQGLVLNHVPYRQREGYYYGYIGYGGPPPDEAHPP